MIDLDVVRLRMTQGYEHPTRKGKVIACKTSKEAILQWRGEEGRYAWLGFSPAFAPFAILWYVNGEVVDRDFYWNFDELLDEMQNISDFENWRLRDYG